MSFRKNWEKIGLVYSRKKDPANWWFSHTMAPTAIELNSNTIRVYIGCWDKNGISRIGWVDLDSENPLKIKNISKNPILDIGREGCFDENGVFPGHACVIDEKIWLYYTGFQLGDKVRHYNFGGLCKSNNGIDFSRVSEAPILDRADEGLTVRAGQSILKEENIFKTVYSAGSSWVSVGGKKRPCYDVFYQESFDGVSFKKEGKLIIRHDPAKEHGLGRPQLLKLNDDKYIFYTKRTLDMKYYLGCAKYNKDTNNWKRLDKEIDFSHSLNGFDSEMVYFPSVIQLKSNNRIFMFYSGNGFGEMGLGVAERCF